MLKEYKKNIENVLMGELLASTTSITPLSVNVKADEISRVAADVLDIPGWSVEERESIRKRGTNMLLAVSLVQKDILKKLKTDPDFEKNLRSGSGS